MSFKKLLALTAIIFLASCRPKPIEIEVPQTSGAFSISSYCQDSHTVYVTASYSFSSLIQTLDTTSITELSSSKDLMMDSAIVTLRGEGALSDTLQKIAPGIYRRNDLELVPGRSYTLTVLDCRKGSRATATTTYFPTPTVDTLYARRRPKGGDTTGSIHLKLSGLQQTSYFFVAYNTARQAREHSTPLPRNVRALSLFVPKQIALFTTSDAVNGKIEKDVTLQVEPNDTVLIQVGQIDKAYYDYLAAYKRTGALINQLTGEPINLPSNISSGYGYFSLYNPVRALFDLSRF
jgi:hypothetical protein